MCSRMRDPILRNWRLIPFEASALGAFLGEVTGHPLLNDGWIITSNVRWISDDRSCARTESRRYQIQEEFPRDQAMPEKPRNILLTRLVMNYGVPFGLASQEKLAELTDYASYLCGPLAPLH